MNTFIFAILLIFSLITSVYATERTANTLYILCQSKNYTDKYICSSYLNGYLDGLISGQIIFLDWNESVSEFTLKNMFLKQMSDHPENGDNDIASVLMHLFTSYGKAQVRPGILSNKK